MKNHAVRVLVLSGIVCLSPLFGFGGEVGELAPPLVVKEWLKGEPVDIKIGTNVFVVEIWATWSPASRASITNLNDIQRRFKDRGVMVAAISDEPDDKLKEFLKLGGTNIEYAVASDDAKTAHKYMATVRERGIPYVFVVGTNTTILWHGTPSPTLFRTLEQITTGQYDLELAKKTEVARHQMEQYLVLAQRADRRTAQAGRNLLAARTNDATQLCDLAFQIATHPRVPKRDVALATEALDQAEKLSPTNAFRVALNRSVLFFETGKTNEAVTLIKQTITSAPSKEQKAEAQSCLGTMEKRLRRQAAVRARAAAGTNVVHSASASNSVAPAAANTNKAVSPPN